MLVLSRKKEESIVIDDVITIKIISTDGSRVQIGIEAPRDISIRRSELPPKKPVAAPLASTSVPLTAALPVSIGG